MSLAAEAPPNARPRLFVLFDPHAAFTSVARRPLWGLAVAVVLASSALAPAVYVARADLSGVVEREMRKSGALEKVPESSRPDAIEKAAKAMKAVVPVGAAVKRSVWMTLLSLLCFAVLRAKDPQLSLWPVAGAVGLAMAPLVVHDLLMTLVYATSDVIWVIDARNPVPSNLASLLHVESRTVAGVLLRAVDVFELWSCALVGYGVCVVANVKSRLPMLVVFGAYLVSIFLSLPSALRGG